MHPKKKKKITTKTMERKYTTKKSSSPSAKTTVGGAVLKQRPIKASTVRKAVKTVKAKAKKEGIKKAPLKTRIKNKITLAKTKRALKKRYK